MAAMCPSINWILLFSLWIITLVDGCQVIINLDRDIHFVSVHDKCLNIVVEQTASSDVAQTVCARKAGRLARMEHNTEERVHNYIQHHPDLGDWGYWIGPSEATTFDSLLYIPKTTGKDPQSRYLAKTGSHWRSFVKHETYLDDKTDEGERRKRAVPNDVEEEEERIDEEKKDYMIHKYPKYNKMHGEANETKLTVEKYHRVPDRIGFICEYYLMANRTTPRVDHESSLKRFVMAYFLFITLVLTQTALTVCFVNSRGSASHVSDELKSREGEKPGYDSVNGVKAKGIEATD